MSSEPLYPDHVREWAVERYVKGHPMETIMRDVGCCYQTIWKWAKKAGVPMRPRGRPKERYK